MLVSVIYANIMETTQKPEISKIDTNDQREQICGSRTVLEENQDQKDEQELKQFRDIMNQADKTMVESRRSLKKAKAILDAMNARLSKIV